MRDTYTSSSMLPSGSARLLKVNNSNSSVWIGNGLLVAIALLVVYEHVQASCIKNVVQVASHLRGDGSRDLRLDGRLRRFILEERAQSGISTRSWYQCKGTRSSSCSSQDRVRDSRVEHFDCGFTIFAAIWVSYIWGWSPRHGQACSPEGAAVESHRHHNMLAMTFHSGFQPLIPCVRTSFTLHGHRDRRLPIRTEEHNQA